MSRGSRNHYRLRLPQKTYMSRTHYKTIKQRRSTGREEVGSGTGLHPPVPDILLFPSNSVPQPLVFPVRTAATLEDHWACSTWQLERSLLCLSTSHSICLPCFVALSQHGGKPSSSDVLHHSAHTHPFCCIALTLTGWSQSHRYLWTQSKMMLWLWGMWLTVKEAAAMGSRAGLGLLLSASLQGRDAKDLHKLRP